MTPYKLYYLLLWNVLIPGRVYLLCLACIFSCFLKTFYVAYFHAHRAELHQIFQEDGKMGCNKKDKLLVSELFLAFRDEGGSEMSLFSGTSWIQLHKIYPTVKKTSRICLYVWQTDRGTDRRTDIHLATTLSPRYAYTSRGKKNNGGVQCNWCIKSRFSTNIWSSTTAGSNVPSTLISNPAIA